MFQMILNNKRPIWPIDDTLTDIIAPNQSRPGCNGKEGVTQNTPHTGHSFLVEVEVLITLQGNSQHILNATDIDL